MKIKLKTNGGYSCTEPSVGKIVEGHKVGEFSGVTVTVEELRRVGCVDADGVPFPYFPCEYEVIKE